MSLGDKKVLSFPIKPETRKAKDSNISRISKRDKVLIFLVVLIFISLSIAFILLLTNTNNTVVVSKKEITHEPNKEINVVVDNTKKEENLTPKPKKTKVCVPNSPFPTEKENIKYTCY